MSFREVTNSARYKSRFFRNPQLRISACFGAAQ